MLTHPQAWRYPIPVGPALRRRSGYTTSVDTALLRVSALQGKQVARSCVSVPHNQPPADLLWRTGGALMSEQAFSERSLHRSGHFNPPAVPGRVPGLIRHALGRQGGIGTEQFLLIKFNRASILPDKTEVIDASRKHSEFAAFDRAQVVDTDLRGSRDFFEGDSAALSHGSSHAKYCAMILHLFQDKTRPAPTPSPKMVNPAVKTP